MQSSLRTASLLGLAALSLLGLAAARPAAAQGYTYTTITSDDLGTSNDTVTGTYQSEATGITNAGIIVGYVPVGSEVPGTNYSPGEGYQYDTNSGAATLLDYQAANYGPTLTAVSGDGLQVLGYYNPGGNGADSYFTDSGGAITALPDPYELTGTDPTAPSSYAEYAGINSSGTTVGNSFSLANAAQSFLRGADGTFTSFTDPNDIYGNTYAYGINSSGTAAGYYFDSSTFDGVGFLRSADGTFTDFTVPGATDTYLLGLSDNGNLFGQYDVYDADGSFVSLDNFTDIGGVFDTSVDVPGAAFTDITGINDAGQISGYYGDGNNNYFSFYGDPVPEASSVVSFGLLLMLGGAVVVARKKKAAAAC
jgi:hypothetical protein